METFFQISFVVILAVTFCVSAIYRYRARLRKPGRSRLDESPLVIFVRLLGAVPLFLIFIIYCIVPAWLAWASFPAPLLVRWIGVALGVLGIAFVCWVFRSIGDNISETILTKPDHDLVTHGPYRLIRHPLYTFALIQILALGFVAQSLLLIGIAMFAAVVFRCIVIPREERNLLLSFGSRYADYQSRTWAMIPWVT